MPAKCFAGKVVQSDSRRVLRRSSRNFPPDPPRHDGRFRQHERAHFALRTGIHSSARPRARRVAVISGRRSLWERVSDRRQPWKSNNR